MNNRRQHQAGATPALLADAGLLVGWEPGNGDECTPMLLGDEGHLMTFAPTGAGKGVSAVVPALLRHRGQAIVIDPKGENVAMTRRFREAIGQQVIVLDPFAITTGPRARLNPFDVLDADLAAAGRQLGAFAEMISPKVVDVTDPMWGESGRLLIIALLLMYVENTSREARNLTGFRKLVRRLLVDPKVLATEMEACGIDAVRRQVSLVRGLDNDSTTSQDIVSHTVGEVEAFAGAVVETSTARTDFALEDLRSGKPMTFYLVIPPDRLRSAAPLVRLWIGALSSILLSRTHRPVQSTLLLLDEAAQLGPMDVFVTAMTLYRSYGVQCWSFWQDMSQLRRTYPGQWETLLNNAAVVQAFGVTCMSLAQQLQPLAPSMQAAELLSLPAHRMLLLRTGRTAAVVQRPDYLRDPVFEGLFDGNPFYRNFLTTGTAAGARLLPELEETAP